MLDDENQIFAVVFNDQEEFSIWPVDRNLPLGWTRLGFEGTEQECLDHIDSIWTLRRPEVLRQKKDEVARREGRQGDG